MTLDAQRYDGQRLEQYWQDVSCRHADASDNGLELICYAGMPQWFNRFIHTFQMKAFERLVASESFAGARLLDIGTGVGRWARLYASRGATVTGIDIEPARLEKARSFGGGITYRQMGADRLEFDDASFDAVNCVTVLQHVPHDVKRAAIAEIGRVTAPGARLVIFELTDMSDDAPHVFPWRPLEWESAFNAQGFRAVRRVGTEYIPLLRLAKRIQRGAGGRGEIDAIKQGRRSMKDRASLAALRAAVVASYPIEEACRFASPDHARISGWLFRREG